MIQEQHEQLQYQDFADCRRSSLHSVAGLGSSGLGSSGLGSSGLGSSGLGSSGLDSSGLDSSGLDSFVVVLD